ncbi:hypothetical protein AAG906_016209 [Vitis piasezkii]
MDHSWMSKDRRSKDYADGSYHTWYWHGDATPSGPPTSRAEWHHTLNLTICLCLCMKQKILNTLGMEYEKIHACPNDCILYRNELKDATSCPTCGTSRWKLDGTSTKKRKESPKVMWFPKIAKDLIWHAQEREFDGKMRHPSDSPSWKLVDHRWPDFASEPRNLRLAISADGPRQPGNDIDVYLAPLLDDLKMLWDVGVECYDVHQQELKDILHVPYVGRYILSQIEAWEKNSYMVDVSALDKLQNDLVVTLCLLEKLCGPVYLRWMYPFERFMKVLKGYVQNRNRPEGCIVECYIAEEAIEFCTEYLSNVDAIGIPISANIDQKVGAPIPGGQVVTIDSNLWLHAHHYVLENTTIVQPYIDHYVSKYHGYVINGCRYHTKERDDLRATQNSGVSDNPTLDFLDMKGGEDFVDNSIEHHPFIGHCHGMGCNSHKIGESTVHLTSYLGMLACTMVPIRYKTWHVVPKQLNDKLWDSIEMVASGSTETIDQAYCGRKQGKKDDTFDEVAIPRIEKIVRQAIERVSRECTGTPEYSGRVRAKGKHYTPRQYFNSAADRAVRDFIAASKEEQRIFQAEVLAKLSQVGAVTPQSDVSSSNMKQKQLLLPEAVDKPIRKVEDVTPPEAIEPQKKVRKCELAIGTKENIVAGGTIILECGPNYLVVVDAPYDSSAPLPIPIPGQTTTVGAAIGYQVLWPTDLVIIRTPILASKKAKKQKVNEVEVKSKGEKPQDMKNFETLVGLMLSTSRTHPINFPDDVFGESFKTFMMKEDMEMIISSKEVSSNCILYYIWHLHRKLIDAKQAERYVFVNPTLVSKAGMGEEVRKIGQGFHWVLVALEMKKMIAYYLDPMACQPCDDLKDIGNENQPTGKIKTSKKEPTWVKVVCPRQPGSVECGYYVMRYMKEIIANPNQLTSKVVQKGIGHSINNVTTALDEGHPQTIQNISSKEF